MPLEGFELTMQISEQRIKYAESRSRSWFGRLDDTLGEGARCVPGRLDVGDVLEAESARSADGWDARCERVKADVSAWDLSNEKDGIATSGEGEDGGAGGGRC